MGQNKEMDSDASVYISKACDTTRRAANDKDSSMSHKAVATGMINLSVEEETEVMGAYQGHKDKE
jgi:hypothetical protein